MPEDATRDFGAYLREARERAGITLRAIANNTKISVPTLEALERNDVARLPGGIFIRAFVRSYAKEVGLDPEDAVRRFVSRFPDAAVEESPAAYEANPEKIVVDEEPTTGRLWRFAWWVLPLVLIVYLGFGGRLNWWRDRAQPAPPRAEPQTEQAPPAPAAPVLTTPAPLPSTEPASSKPTGTTDGTAAPIPSARPAEPPVQAGEPPAPVAGEGQFRLILTPRGRCWVTVRSNGKIVFTGTMNPGDRQDLVLGGNVSLTLGNAGVMGVSINGQPARPLGGEGQVVTTLMNIQNLKTFLEAR
jgi:cytoskeleton protein RodZ